MLQTPVQSIIEFTAHVIKISSQITVFMKESVYPVLFCECIMLQIPVQSKIEFTAHLIKLSSQIGWCVFVGHTYLSMRFTPKIFHLSVSHQNILANNSGSIKYICKKSGTMWKLIYMCGMFMYEITEFVASHYIATPEVWIHTRLYEIKKGIKQTLRCWCKHIFNVNKNGRRDITRRYFLGNVQSEDMFMNGMEFLAIYFICTTLLVGL